MLLLRLHDRIYYFVTYYGICSNAECNNNIVLNIDQVKLSYDGICAHNNDTKTPIIMWSTWERDDNIKYLCKM